MFSGIDIPFALGTLLSVLLNNLYVCPFIVTKILAKSQFENLTISQMTLREISRLNRTSLSKQ